MVDLATDLVITADNEIVEQRAASATNKGLAESLTQSQALSTIAVLNAIPELRPPSEHAHKQLHWVKLDPQFRLGSASSDVNPMQNYEPQVWRWAPHNELNCAGWLVSDSFAGRPRLKSPLAAFREGYRYLGPAEYTEDPYPETKSKRVWWPKDWPAPLFDWTGGSLKLLGPPEALGEMRALRAAVEQLDESARRIADLEAEVAMLRASFTTTPIVVAVAAGSAVAVGERRPPPIPLRALRPGDGRPR